MIKLLSPIKAATLFSTFKSRQKKLFFRFSRSRHHCNSVLLAAIFKTGEERTKQGYFSSLASSLFSPGGKGGEREGEGSIEISSLRSLGLLFLDEGEVDVYVAAVFFG